MAKDRQVGQMQIGTYHGCAVWLSTVDPDTGETVGKWHPGLTVEIEEIWAYVYAADESRQRISRKTNKSAQVYPGMTVHEAMAERRSNHIRREGLSRTTIAAIQADYDADPLPPASTTEMEAAEAGKKLNDAQAEQQAEARAKQRAADAEKYIRQADLKSRGWSKGMMRTLLGVPIESRAGGAGSAPCYLRTEVEWAEQTPKWADMRSAIDRDIAARAERDTPASPRYRPRHNTCA
jgi:hypothetical protein